MDTKTLGNVGENLAVDYLKKKKYKILDRNWRIKQGEIDIVARHKGKMVFVEVKTIKEKDGFLPEDEITPKKKKRLVKLAQLYLLKNKLPLDTKQQIDILAIEMQKQGEPNIRHLKNVLEDAYY